LAVCQPNDILLSSFGAAVADRISAFLFPGPSSDSKRISVVGERFSFVARTGRWVGGRAGRQTGRQAGRLLLFLVPSFLSSLLSLVAPCWQAAGKRGRARLLPLLAEMLGHPNRPLPARPNSKKGDEFDA
jgi:hypothetical protein